MVVVCDSIVSCDDPVLVAFMSENQLSAEKVTYAVGVQVIQI